MSKLALALVQYEIAWKDKHQNFLKIESLCSKTTADLIILPEMFQTGFCVNDLSLAEDEGGETLAWMMGFSTKKNAAVCGSILFKEAHKVFNRFLVVQNETIVFQYDKAHLFKFGGEDKYISKGSSISTFSLNNFTLLPSICYDIRFPYQSYEDYDILINVANWPTARIEQWSSLLCARAVENQAFVVGVNTLSNGKNKQYPGNSGAWSPNGKKFESVIGEQAKEINLNLEDIVDFRAAFPFLLDKRKIF